jgi:hypothetical protein
MRKFRYVKVSLSEHAKDRWIERAGRPPGKLPDLIALLLIEQLAAGLTVRDGKAMLPLSAQALCLPDDLVACIGLPDWRGSGKWLRLSLLERGC